MPSSHLTRPHMSVCPISRHGPADNAHRVTGSAWDLGSDQLTSWCRGQFCGYMQNFMNDPPAGLRPVLIQILTESLPMPLWYSSGHKPIREDQTVSMPIPMQNNYRVNNSGNPVPSVSLCMWKVITYIGTLCKPFTSQRTPWEGARWKWYPFH